MKTRVFIFVLLSAIFNTVSAQEVEMAVKDNGITENWFLQVGLDMGLQNPHGYNFKNVFPNGKSFGVDAAIGKWFSPEIGVRSRVNWENGISLFKNDHANWLAPFNQPGVNMDKGGYISVHSDLLIDVQNTVLGYDEDRKWNTQLFLRGGGVYNFGTSKGSPLIGAGIGNTYKINDKLGVYCDVAYNGVSTGFTMDPSTATGVGSGSNMYFTIDVGVQYNLGKQNKELTKTESKKLFPTFWKNWYLQFGVDMTLYNPCEKDFSEALTKGRTFGVDVALGKWFTPLVGTRAKLNWENGIIDNSKLEWLAYDEKDKSNKDGGGCLMLYVDGMLSLKHLVMDMERNEKWNSYLFARMGLGKNVSIDSLSPVVGIGVGGTHRLNDRLSVYAETAYEGITSEFFSGISWSGPTGTAFNGIWDFNVGVQIYL